MFRRISVFGFLLILLVAGITGASASEERVLTADVIVVGAGTAGINTAITAADYGASVILIEKTGRVGGAKWYAGGTLTGTNTLMQYEAGITNDSPYAYYADIVRGGGGMHVPELAWYYVHHAGQAVDYMDRLGVDFGDRVPSQSGYNPFDILRMNVAVEGGRGFIKVMEPELQKRVDRGDVEIHLNTRATTLLQDEQGHVIGVQTVDVATGEVHEYSAKATVLCTGGYGANHELMAEFGFPNILSYTPEFATGDGFEMARAIGAGYSDMEYIPVSPGGVPNPEFPGRFTAAASVAGYPGTIWVNTHGERIADEYGSDSLERAELWRVAPENTVFILFDHEIRQTGEPIFRGDWALFDQQIEAGHSMKKADSLEELAEAFGIPAASLLETVETFNDYVDQGVDLDFGRQELTHKLENPPFYGIKTFPFVLLPMGGPNMNVDSQVLDSNGKVIWGLYQAGEVMGFAKLVGHGLSGGIGNTAPIVWGKVAGRNAALYSLGK